MVRWSRGLQCWPWGGNWTPEQSISCGNCALHSSQPGTNRKHVALEEVFPCHSQPRTILALLSLEKWIFLSPVQENDGQEAGLHPDWKAQTAAWRVKARTYYGHHWFSSSCRLTSLGKYQTSSLMRPLILLSKVRKKKKKKRELIAILNIFPKTCE